MNKLAQMITEEYGERCPDFDGGCILCRVWKTYDGILNPGSLSDEQADLVMHWIDRFAAGIDSHAQIDRILDRRALKGGR